MGRYGARLPCSEHACHINRVYSHPHPQFKVYLVIEGFVWLPACYAFCYRFQPTIRIAQSPAGRRAVQSASSYLERVAPSTHATLAKLAAQAQGAPAGRAAAEWALLNKVSLTESLPSACLCEQEQLVDATISVSQCLLAAAARRCCLPLLLAAIASRCRLPLLIVAFACHRVHAFLPRPRIASCNLRRWPQHI